MIVLLNLMIACVSAAPVRAPVRVLLPEIRAEILKAPFLERADYAKKFVRAVQPLNAGPGATLRLESGAIKAASAALERSGRRLALDAELLGPFAMAQQKQPHAAFLGVFRDKAGVAGILGYVVRAQEDGARVGEIHSVYFDKSRLRTSGIAEEILDYTATGMAPAVRVKHETLKADYAGRYVWAKQGFSFDPNYRYYDIDGKTYRSAEMARRSLARFLKAHGVRIGDLRLRGRKVGSLDVLATPADFAMLTQSGGRGIRVAALVGQGMVAAEAPMPVGKAFMMASYLPAAPPFVLSQGGPRFGTKFAVDAMPFWNGYRDLP